MPQVNTGSNQRPPLHAALERAARQAPELARGQCLLVAVSGGADSVALLQALAALAPHHAWRLRVAHLHHGLRGAAADADARFVRRLAASLGCPAHIRKADVAGQARCAGVSLEMAGRAARLAFFRDLARRHRAAAVVLAHTADDQAETLLLRLARGASPAGLAGMPMRQCLAGLVLVRPMLDCTHAAAVRYLDDRKLAWREDASNRDPAFLRNRVRHEILPLLATRLNPQVRAALCRAANLMQEEQAWISAMVAGRLADCRAAGGALSVAALRRLDPAARRRVLLQWLAERGAPVAGAEFRAVAGLAAWLERTARNGFRPWSGAWQIARNGDLLSAQPAPPAATARLFRVRLAIPGVTPIPGTRWQIRAAWRTGILQPSGEALGRAPCRASLRAAAVGRAAVFVRAWQAGDAIHPLGVDGHKKIQDIFVDAKLPRAARQAWPLVECRGQIAWLPGYRIAQAWALRQPQEQALHLILEELPPN